MSFLCFTTGTRVIFLPNLKKKNFPKTASN
jgi:hypothetical protein